MNAYKINFYDLSREECTRDIQTWKIIGADTLKDAISFLDSKFPKTDITSIELIGRDIITLP